MKTEKNTSYKALSCILLVMAMLFIPLVSAYEFDNQKYYDANTNTITIKNCALWIGTCWIDGETMAEMQLISPQNVRVGTGYQKVAEFTMENFKSDYGNAFQDMNFYDMNVGGEEITREFDYKYLTYVNTQIYDFETVCTEKKYPNNQTYYQDCKQEEAGFHWEDVEKWEKFSDINELPPNQKVTIGIFTEVQVNDYVEWIPTFMGKEISEWASWTADLNTNIISYYKMNETAGNILDAVGNYPLTNDGAEYEATGIIGTAMDFVSANTDYLKSNAVVDLTANGGDFTIGMWIKPDNVVANHWALTLDVATVFGIITSGTEVCVVMGGGQCSSGAGIGIGNWYHVVATGDGTTVRLYVDSVSVKNVTTAYVFTATEYLYVGVHGTELASYFDGIIDEVGIWNRVLTPAEIIQLYNGGAGITYTAPFSDSSPNATLISPVNTTNYTASPQSIDFTCYGSDDTNFANMSFYLDGVLTETNISGLNNTNYIFPQSLTEGYYNWSCRATDNESQQTDSETWFVNITLFPPTTNLISPIDTYNSSEQVDDFEFNITMITGETWENYTFYVWNSTDIVRERFVENGVADTDCSETLSGNNITVECIGQMISPTDDYEWNVYGCLANAKCDWADANFTFTIDATDPILSVAYNLSDIVTLNLPTNSTWHYNVTDPHIDSCYYNTTESAVYETITCNSTINTQWTTGGAKTIQFCANDTFGNEGCNTTTIDIYDFSIVQSGDATVSEGTSHNFYLYVNSNSYPIGDASAVLWWNGTNQGVTTKTVTNTNQIVFKKTLLIPDGSGNSTGFNQSWLWNYTATNLANRNTTTQQQTVYAVSITDCGVTSGYTILNLSLKDEETNTLVNITAPNVENIELDLTVTSLTNSSLTWEFSKHWTANNTVAVCVPVGLLNETEYQIDFTVGFDSTDKVREFYYMDTGSLDFSGEFNSYTSNHISLMDLLSADSTTFLFEYTDADNQKVDDIVVHTFRDYIGEGIFREVERSKQDNSGQTHVHLVEEDVIYYFMITQYGEILFTSDTYNAKCLSTPCEITLSASATEQNWSIIDNEGGNYVVTSDTDTRVVTTTFNLDTISLVNASVYLMWNTSGVPELVNSSSLTATSGSIDLFIPLSYGNATYFVSIYKDNEFIKSSWVSMDEGAMDYFGTFGAILGGFVVLAMMLMAVTEGAGFIVVTILAVIIIGIMGLVDLGWMAIISIICAGAIIIWKLINRRGTRQ